MRALRWTVLVVLAVALLVSACGGRPLWMSTGLSPVTTTPESPALGAAARPHADLRATANPSPAPKTVTLTVAAQRHHGHVASAGRAAPYNYAPSVMADGDRYRMWWCSQLPQARPPGDDIVYAVAPSLDGPFRAPGGRKARPVFHGAGGGFDAMHTCDPSVIRVDGRYYLYYTGSTGHRAHGNSIGVATSADGIHFTRANHGKPIVKPSHGTRRANTYGAGQPSALYLDGWFYLMFTDTTAPGAGWNGAGQFVIRSPDPLFRHDVQLLSKGGFVAATGTAAARDRSIVDAFSADWMFSDALNAFAVAHETARGTTITFWNREFTRNPYQPVEIAGSWQEGPGLARDPRGHAPVAAHDPCGRVPIDVVRATRDAASPTGLAHFGLDVRGIDGCATKSQALALLDGYGMPSSRGTTEVVPHGTLVGVARQSVAEKLVRRILDHPVPVLDQVTPALRVTPRLPALSAHGRPLALLLPDGRLSVIGSKAVARANSSPIVPVTKRQWDRYPRGVDLSRSRP